MEVRNFFQKLKSQKMNGRIQNYLHQNKKNCGK